MTRGAVYDHAWRKVRLVVLERDGWVCQIRGPSCDGTADQVDHIVPVADNGPRLDPGNLRAACKACNVGRASRQKAREGWRRSATRVTLVVGPPGADLAGRVAEVSGGSDVVVDYDTIAAAVGGSHEAAMAARNALLRDVRRGEVEAARAWITSTNPHAEDMFPFHELVEVDPGRDVAVEACREAGKDDLVGLVHEWYETRAAAAGPSREW